jgi:replicative DNA helicase
MAAHAALEANRPVLFFSLEMSHLEITQRLLASEARVDSTRMRNGRLEESDWTKISHGIGRLAEAPLYIDDNPRATVLEIRAKARRLKSRLGDLGLVVVDYLGDQPGAQGPGPGAADPCGGPLPALPGPGAAGRQAAHARRPA